MPLLTDHIEDKERLPHLQANSSKYINLLNTRIKIVSYQRDTIAGMAL